MKNGHWHSQITSPLGVLIPDGTLILEFFPVPGLAAGVITPANVFFSRRYDHSQQRHHNIEDQEWHVDESKPVAVDPRRLWVY